MISSTRTTLSHLACVAVAATLLACGGGGGDDDSTPATAQGFSGQGVWDTTITPQGLEGGALVLEDGTVWAFAADTDTNNIEALHHGQLELNGSNLGSANLRAFDMTSGNYANVSAVSGTLAASTFTLNGSIAGNASAVEGVRSAADAAYNYDTPAQLSDIAGNWSGIFSSGDDGVVSVQSNGNFSSTTSAGCSFTGSATPRASGKNVFNVSIAFGPAPCLLPNTSGSGVALATKATATDPALLTVMAITPDRSAAAIYIALRGN